jgi:hypothetical protein
VEQVVPAAGAEHLHHPLTLLVAVDRHVDDVPPGLQGVAMDLEGVGLVAILLSPPQELPA